MIILKLIYDVMKCHFLLLDGVLPEVFLAAKSKGVF